MKELNESWAERNGLFSAWYLKATVRASVRRGERKKTAAVQQLGSGCNWVKLCSMIGLLFSFCSMIVRRKAEEI